MKKNLILFFLCCSGIASAQMPGTPYMPYVFPATITLGQNRSYFVASVYDTDYLPYATPVTAANTTAMAADGINESVTLDIQGAITTTGITVTIPVIATGSNTLPAYSSSINVPAALTEDGISRDLTLSWAVQGYTSATTSITATIAAVGGTLNAKKLDINAGIGNDYLGVLLGTFTYPYNNAGNTTTYAVHDISGIPDKMFGQADNTGSTTTHSMLYIPIQGEDGNTWLNNNLGTDYSNINSGSFNPVQQATAYNDYHAYGSLFQWGRSPDGHELINWTGGTTGSAVNGTTATNNDAPGDALFILESYSPFDWRATQDDTLWATEASTNNPCPGGFRVPTLAEQTALVTAAGITNYTNAASSILKFSAAGYRLYGNGALFNSGSYGCYWNSSVNDTNTSRLSFNSGSADLNDTFRGFGLSVRCLKN